jgi:carnosine synthase
MTDRTKKFAAAALAALLALLPAGPAATAWAGPTVDAAAIAVPESGAGSSAAAGASVVAPISLSAMPVGQFSAAASPAFSALSAPLLPVQAAVFEAARPSAAPAPAAALAHAPALSPHLPAAAAREGSSGKNDSGKTRAADPASELGGLTAPSDESAAQPGRIFDQSQAHAGSVADPVAVAAEANAGLETSGRSRRPSVERLVRRSPEGSEAEQLSRLATQLEKQGLPPLKKIVVDKDEPLRPTVAWLVNASQYKVAIAREGGRQAPGDWHMVLDASWYEHEIVTPQGRTVRTQGLPRDDAGRLVDAPYAKLYLKKGVYFDEKGQAFLAEYTHPRAVGQFANFFTVAANDREDGVPFEYNLDVPMSSDETQLTWYKDKFITTLLAAREGGGVPITLGFVNPKHPVITDPYFSKNQVKEASHLAMPATKAEIRAAVLKFLEVYKGEEVVVKPSGAYFRSARGVELIKRTEVEKIVQHVWDLKHDPHMSDDGAVILSERLEPPAVYYRTGKYEGHGPFGVLLGHDVSITPLTRAEIAALPPGASERKDWNLRVFVQRTPTGGVEIAGTFVRAGAWGGATNAEPADTTKAAAVVKFEDLLDMLRLQHPGMLDTPAQTEAFRAKIQHLGESVLNGIRNHDATRVRREGEPYQSRVIFVGLDVMASVKNGVLVPATIESNGHDSGGQTQHDRFYPENVGVHSRALAATTLDDARRNVLRGKRIVVVGDGYDSKRFIFEKAKELGIQVVLVAKKGSWAQKYATEFIEVDNTKPDALDQAQAALRRSIKKSGPIDGITSFWEADMELTADLARTFGKPMHRADGVKAMRSKIESAEWMVRAGMNVSRTAEVTEPRNGSAAEIEKSRARLRQALEQVGYPALLKLKFGAAAAGMRIVSDWPEALKAYDHMISLTSAENNNKHHGDDVAVVQALNGIEFDADGSRQKGETLFLKVTDNWPVERPYTLATGSSSPSRALTEKQKALVAREIERAAKLFGADDGVIHFEGMLVPGPNGDEVYIFDTNPRVGGHYVPVWVEKVWGRDLIEDMFLIAAGIPAGKYSASKPLTHMEGPFITPHVTGVVSEFHLTAKGLAHPGLVELEKFRKPGERYSGPPLGGERLGMLHVKGDTAEEAQRNLREIQAELVVKIKPDPRQ